MLPCKLETSSAAHLFLLSSLPCKHKQEDCRKQKQELNVQNAFSSEGSRIEERYHVEIFLEQEEFICTLPGSHCRTCSVADSMFVQKPHKQKHPSAVPLLSENNMKKNHLRKCPLWSDSSEMSCAIIELHRLLKMVFGYSQSGLFLDQSVPQLVYLYAFSLAQLLQEEVVHNSLFPINFL